MGRVPLSPCWFPHTCLAHPPLSQPTRWGFSALERGPGLILKPIGPYSPGAWLQLPALLGTRAGEGRQALTVVTSPVDVDASAIVAGKLSQGEAGGIGCQGESGTESGPDDYTAPKAGRCRGSPVTRSPLCSQMGEKAEQQCLSLRLCPWTPTSLSILFICLFLSGEYVY